MTVHHLPASDLTLGGGEIVVFVGIEDVVGVTNGADVTNVALATGYGLHVEGVGWIITHVSPM